MIKLVFMIMVMMMIQTVMLGITTYDYGDEYNDDDYVGQKG